MKETLYDLLTRYNIIIPQIQRDYAQGRSGQSELRKNFISERKKALLDDTSSLNLDFVYGYTEQINGEEEAFIPLDGQQRLTTLWLLHWYLAPKEVKEVKEAKEEEKIEVESLPEEIKKWLRKFTYETRNSSKRFCEELIDNSLPKSDQKRSELISDASWFMASWRKDPTVISMLNMLDTIQQEELEKAVSWKNLIQHKKITFDYIDIKSDEFKLSDELYIKMNSRGKPLTSFENFKAKFSEILSSTEADYLDEKMPYQGAQISYRQYFAFKIDGAWMDLFWDLSKQNKSIDVDQCFMNYFTYIAQLGYFKNNPDKSVDEFKDDGTVFLKKENVLFLFNSLDWLYDISLENNQIDSKRVDCFFSELFQLGKIDDTYKNKVRLFEEESRGINLFEKCLLEGTNFDNRNKIILYCLFAFALKYKLSSASEELKGFIRVIRNLLQATRQRTEVVFNTNVRINSFGKYWKLFAQLLEQEDVYNCLIEKIDNSGTDISNDAFNREKQKAEIIVQKERTVNAALFRLEEYKPLGGLIHQLKPQEHVSKLAQYAKAIREIGSKDQDNSLVVGAMIASGFNGLYTKMCKLGEMWFFGTKEKWNTILTAYDDDISKSTIQLLDNYLSESVQATPKERLQNIIDRYLSHSTKKDWRYYFLKYPLILSKSNYFAWKPKSDFEIRILGSYNSNPLLAYHINPYVLVVSNLLNDCICEEREAYSQYGYPTGLLLKNGIRLHCEEEGWTIELPEKEELNDLIRQRYNIGDNLLLVESGDKDRIEIAVDFCQAVYDTYS